ncbi:hypothetical protein ACSHWB_35935 [Lentzea sp. HUAS TT2]|uniref:hypothetical protein n=1 Tax=Lentzea sp. HUAS TT2 TaxID=3447454 RepID=UPI003F71FFD5
MGVLLTLAGGWLVTTRVTDRWDRVKKARELDLAAAQDFQRLYGEFFAVWKIWNAANEDVHAAEPPDGVVWALLERASVMEGGIEALLTKVCAERILSDSDVEALGSLRQAFQQLRKSMRRNRKLPWHFSGAAEYVAMKNLAVFMSSLLRRGKSARRPPSPEAAATAFRSITDNRFESDWIKIAHRQFPSTQPANGASIRTQLDG